MTFEWDARKAAANLKKHKIAFEDAATVFLDPLAVTFADPDHSFDECREITIGCKLKGLRVFHGSLNESNRRSASSAAAHRRGRSVLNNLEKAGLP